MEFHEFEPNYFADSLVAAIEFVRPERRPLIENFIYDKTSTLFYAPDGVGKSVLLLQACMQSTVKDSKVFGEFHVPESCNVLYFQMERHPDETFERMRHMRQGIPFDPSKFCLSVGLQGLNIQNQKPYDDALKFVRDTIEKMGIIPNIIAFDPIYTMVGEGLEKAEACNALTNFFRVIQINYNCAIMAVSHSNRGTYDKETKQREGADMYGNRFLSAHFGGVYSITSLKEGAGTKFKLDKTSLKNLEKSFELFYEPQYYRSMVLDDGKVTKKDRLYNFIKTQKSLDKPFTFDDLKAVSLLSDSILRGYLTGELKDRLKVVDKINKGKLLYKYCG